MRKKKNVLILGATGFIGKNLIEHFQKKKKFNIVATYHTKKKINKYKVKWKKENLLHPLNEKQSPYFYIPLNNL